jgi:recombination protein RecA
MSALANAFTGVHPATAFLPNEPKLLGFTLGGIPRGAVTEIAGPASSGRSSILCALLAEATAEGEFCALIDTDGSFDPASAAAVGVRLSQVLWVRCKGNIEHALKAADLLTQAGGFGLLAIDLADVTAKSARRIPLAAWFRLRHAAESTKTALLAIGSNFSASTAAAVKVELSRERVLWKGKLLDGVEMESRNLKHVRVPAFAGKSSATGGVRRILFATY